MTLTCIPCPHTHFVMTLNFTGVEANMFHCIVFKDYDFLFKIINCSLLNHKSNLELDYSFHHHCIDCSFLFLHDDLQ